MMDNHFTWIRVVPPRDCNLVVDIRHHRSRSARYHSNGMSRKVIRVRCQYNEICHIICYLLVVHMKVGGFYLY